MRHTPVVRWIPVKYVTAREADYIPTARERNTSYELVRNCSGGLCSGEKTDWYESLFVQE